MNNGVTWKGLAIIACIILVIMAVVSIVEHNNRIEIENRRACITRSYTGNHPGETCD